MSTRTKLTREEWNEAKKVILENTGYSIKSSTIFAQMFRRSSFAAETGEASNEIFEFIGDQVLSYYVVKIISDKCGALSLTRSSYTFRLRENQFTQIKQSLINNKSLAKIIDEWGIAKYLLLGLSDINNESYKDAKVKADLFEAIIGAIAIDSGWDKDVLETAVSKSLNIDEEIAKIIDAEAKTFYLDVDIDNAVTTLKELAEKDECKMPIYSICGPDKIGYDSDGNPKWSCMCLTSNDKTGITRQVFATNKKDAKKAAAYLTLCEHLGVQNKYGPNDPSVYWIYKDGRLLPDCTTKNRRKKSSSI